MHTPAIDYLDTYYMYGLILLHFFDTQNIQDLFSNLLTRMTIMRKAALHTMKSDQLDAPVIDNALLDLLDDRLNDVFKYFDQSSVCIWCG